MDEVLLKISIPGSIAFGNWSLPDLIDSIIVSKREADIIKYFYKKYPKIKSSFYYGYDFSCLLKDYKIEYVYNLECVTGFKQIYANRYCSAFLFDHIQHCIIEYFRVHIEKSINKNDYYDPEEDDISIKDLKIIDNKIIIDKK